MRAFKTFNLARALGTKQAKASLGSSSVISRYFNSNKQQHESQNRTDPKLYALALGVTGVATSYYVYNKFQKNKGNPDEKIDTGHTTKGPLYSRKEVAQHNSPENGVWITYKGGVYDITKFIEHHPGGRQIILLGAGGDVEPFWQTYTVHNAPEVQNLLKTYQIGYLASEELENIDKQSSKEPEADPYENDPKRNPLLQVLSAKPYNAETPSKLLVASSYTPVDIFFVRNHLPVPEIDLEDYSLSVCIGTDKDPDNLKLVGEFTLDDLKTKFKPHTIDCVLQCSGNRRKELKTVKEIKGLDWTVGAMGNASWTGVKLIDLLENLGLKLDDDSVKHVQLEGLDCDMSGQSYAASVSADVAFDRNKEVILAYEMNGKPLSRDHGFPLRVVAPGITGARNVKWLSKIILSHEESNSHWQRNDYKGFSPNVDLFNVDWTKSASLQEMPVQSTICDPVDGEKLKLKAKSSSKSETDTTSERLSFPVRGYAYSGGRMILRVDVSLDGGKSWLTANLDDVPKNADGTQDYTNRNKTGSWTRWSLQVEVPDELVKSGGGSLELLCRAFDSAYNSQPERKETVWNVRGLVNNSWHKVKLNLSIEK